MGKHKDFNVHLDFPLNVTVNFEFLDILDTQKEIYFSVSWKEYLTCVE